MPHSALPIAPAFSPLASKAAEYEQRIRDALRNLPYPLTSEQDIMDWLREQAVVPLATFVDRHLASFVARKIADEQRAALAQPCETLSLTQ